jgi:hypothetical protein
LTANDFDKAFGSDPTARDGFAKRVRRDGPAPANDDHKEAEDEAGYRAYGFLPTNSVGETCEVKRWIDGTTKAEGIEFQYRFLTQIGFVGDEQIRLFLPDCIVVIEGAHLLELRKRLARRQITFIQQYSVKIWPKAPPYSDSLVERIEVLRPMR